MVTLPALPTGSCRETIDVPCRHVDFLQSYDLKTVLAKGFKRIPSGASRPCVKAETTKDLVSWTKCRVRCIWGLLNGPTLIHGLIGHASYGTTSQETLLQQTKRHRLGRRGSDPMTNRLQQQKSACCQVTCSGLRDEDVPSPPEESLGSGSPGPNQLLSISGAAAGPPPSLAETP